MKVLFIHRSVGQNFLDEADVRSLLPGVDFHDLNANTNTFTNERGEVEDSVISVSEGNTNPYGFAVFFESAVINLQLQEALEAYDWVAFKSCYSASAMPADLSLNTSMAAYEGAIKQFIISHPTIRFLIISPPPRRWLFTNKDAARRARAFAVFLGEFAAELPNVTYFDLFYLLSDNDGYLKKDYQRWLPIDQHPNRAGSEKAGHAFANNFLN